MCLAQKETRNYESKWFIWIESDNNRNQSAIGLSEKMKSAWHPKHLIDYYEMRHIIAAHYAVDRMDAEWLKVVVNAHLSTGDV